MRHRHFILMWMAYAVTVLPLRPQTPNITVLVHNAEAGDAKAQFELAQAFWEGTGIPKDSAKGLEWLRKSASQGYAGAEVTLGVLYQNGVQVPKDPHEAAKWYRKAAKQSDKDPKHAAKAQSNLASLAAEGVISVDEADWHAQEPGEPAQPVKNPEVKVPSVKTGEAKSDQGKTKAAPFSLAEV